MDDSQVENVRHPLPGARVLVCQFVYGGFCSGLGVAKLREPQGGGSPRPCPSSPVHSGGSSPTSGAEVPFLSGQHCRPIPSAHSS